MNQECYSTNRTRVFEIYGLDPDDNRYNCHHIIQKKDRKNGDAKGIDINKPSNLIMLDKKEHSYLHKYLDSHPIVDIVSMRVKIANIIFNGDECDYEKEFLSPEYAYKPIKVRKVKEQKKIVEHKNKKQKNIPNRYHFEPLDINADIHFRKISNKAGKRRNSCHR